jgi:hypothetical protein
LTPWTTDTYLALINCTRMGSTMHEGENCGKLMGLFLRRLNEDDQYARVKVADQELVNDATTLLNQRIPLYQRIASKKLSRYPDNPVLFRRLERRSRDVAVNVRQIELSRTEDDYFADRVYGFRICDELLRRDSNGFDLFEVDGKAWDAAERILTTIVGRDVSGTIGYLDISKQKMKIKMIKLGFDFDFNPTCFLAESSAIEHKEGGQLPHWQYTPGDINGAKSIFERSSDDIDGWDRFWEANGRMAAVSGNEKHEGLWALKGDRINGLDVYLQRNTKDPIRIHVILKKRSFRRRLVWELEIRDLPLRDTRFWCFEG